MQVALFLRDDQKRFVVSQMELDCPQWTTEMSLFFPQVTDLVAQFHFGMFFSSTEPDPTTTQKTRLLTLRGKPSWQVLMYTLSTSSWAVKWTSFCSTSTDTLSSAQSNRKERVVIPWWCVFFLYTILPPTDRRGNYQLKIKQTKLNSRSCISLHRMIFIRLCTHCPK